jgi:hypothetical protein
MTMCLESPRQDRIGDILGALLISMFLFWPSVGIFFCQYPKFMTNTTQSNKVIIMIFSIERSYINL